MIKLYIMIGISGSGKSTIAKKIAQKDKCIIVSTDQIRKELTGSEEDQSKNKLVFNVAYKRIKDLFYNKQNIIFDATSISNKSRDKIKQSLADIWNYLEIIIIYIDTELSIAKDRNNKRKRKVPEKIIEKQYKILKKEEKDIKTLSNKIIVINNNKYY